MYSNGEVIDVTEKFQEYCKTNIGVSENHFTEFEIKNCLNRLYYL